MGVIDASDSRSYGEELVSADASERVLRAQLLSHAGADRAEVSVANLVTEPVIDLLEPVDVDVDNCHRVTLSLGLADRDTKTVIAMTTIW